MLEEIYAFKSHDHNKNRSGQLRFFYLYLLLNFLLQLKCATQQQPNLCVAAGPIRFILNCCSPIKTFL